MAENQLINGPQTVNVPVDQEQQAANSGTITQAQADANANMEQQIAQKEEQQVQDRLDSLFH